MTLTKILGFSRDRTWKKIENNSMTDIITAVTGINQVVVPKIPGRINPRVPMNVHIAVMYSNGWEIFPSF
jgi:hypothetical protein